MKSNFRVLVISLLLIVSLLLVSACGPSIPKELQDPEVKLVGVYPLELGSGSFTYNLVFGITNPNTIMISMDTLQYRISVDYSPDIEDFPDEVTTAVLAQAQLLDDVYIPPGMEVRVTSAFSVPLGSAIGEAFMAKGADNLKYLPQSMQDLIASGQMDEASVSGMVSVGAIAGVFSMWKLVGGSRQSISPDVDLMLEAAWDAAPDGPLVFTANGSASFSSVAGPAEIEFTSQWESK